jgi:glycosyltransferase involved in cell wall biosynthesis
MLESYLHHKFLKSYRNIGCFICPSKFILNNVRNMGLKGEFEYLPNFINLEDFCFHHESDGKTIAYWGRISVEKGLLTLFKAIKKLEVRLLLIGDGPQKNELKDFAYKENINVTFVDSLKSEFLFKKVQNIMFSVCPSECLENNPNAVLESFALGKPVIGANIGGIPELVIDHKTGLLFESGNSEDLRKKILFLLNNKNELKKMSENSRNLIEKKFEEKIHYEKLIEIYKKVT